MGGALPGNPIPSKRLMSGPASPLGTRAQESASAGRSRIGSWGRSIYRFPIPFAAASGLVVGSVLTYLAHAPTLGGYVWLATLLGGGIPLVLQTIRRLLKGQFSSDVIAMLAILGAIALDQAFAGVVIVIMQSGGEALESYAFHRASSSLDALLQRSPRSAHRRRGDAVDEIPAESVAIGDLLVVRTGDLLPVDGLVVDRETLIDDSTITGEPMPRRHPAGDTLLSGTVNVGPPFDLRALRRSQESQYAQIVELVRTAQERKPVIQRLADRYAVWFTPLALLVAAVGWYLTMNADTALAVLVVATPCPLIIATPIAVIGAVNRAAEEGIVVKSGGAIEEIGRAQVVIFDKTGTITSGQPEIETVVTFGGTHDPTELLRFAAGLELLSSHPLGAAVVRGAQASSVAVPRASEVAEIAGSGVEGVVAGHRVLVGSASLTRARLGIDPAADRISSQLPADTRGRMVSYVGVDGALAGAILFADRIRPGVPEMIARLGEIGVGHVVMLTGDSAANAQEIAKIAHVPEYSSELGPQAKVEQVRSYRSRYGSTVMVGDGVNDAAALAAASVGVAMGARGAGISAEAADVVLLVDDVTKVADGISLGQRMVGIARQGIVLGLGASIALMAIAASGFIAPAIGATLQEGIDVAVIVNALRVRA
jgi:heavy metal translocating P-type ATPase